MTLNNFLKYQFPKRLDIFLSDGSKYAHGKRGYLHEGGWEAIHVIQVGPDEEGMAHYCLTSSIMLSLTTDSDTSGTFNLSGSIRRQVTADHSVGRWSFCANMGKMIEELEGKLRNQLDQVYFGKTKEMVCTLRPPSELLSMTLPDSRNP
ncbi:probable F-actin-capping protein subunit beta [Tanacetum coccineum]